MRISDDGIEFYNSFRINYFSLCHFKVSTVSLLARSDLGKKISRQGAFTLLNPFQRYELHTRNRTMSDIALFVCYAVANQKTFGRFLVHELFSTQVGRTECKM